MLTVIFAAIGIFVWCRMRKRRSPRLPVDQREESIPLNARLDDETAEDGEVYQQRQRKDKGKERAVDSQEPPIFNVGDSDDEEYKDEYKS